jgi:hypothetical protein
VTIGFEDGPSRIPLGGAQYLVSVPASAFTNVNCLFDGTTIVTGPPYPVTVSVARTMAYVPSCLAEVVNIIRPIFPAALTSSVIERAPNGPSVVGFTNHVGSPDAVRPTTVVALDFVIVTPYWCIETPSTATIPSSFSTAPRRVNNASPASGLPVEPNADGRFDALNGREIQGVGKLAPTVPANLRYMIRFEYTIDSVPSWPSAPL